jgi:hypothetical protein
MIAVLKLNKIMKKEKRHLEKRKKTHDTVVAVSDARHGTVVSLAQENHAWVALVALQLIRAAAAAQ